MPNIPRPVLYGLGAIFIAAAAWFFYFDKATTTVAKAPAPAAAGSARRSARMRCNREGRDSL